MEQNKKGYIYKYTFPNGKVYIGQTKTDVNKRHKQHMHLSKHPFKSRLCEKAIAKYGEPLLETIEIVECNDNEEKLNELLNFAENKWIKLYKSENPIYGYNAKRGGKREGSGRKPYGCNTHATSLRLDKDLFDILILSKINKNRYINNAVREKMKNDGLL